MARIQCASSTADGSLPKHFVNAMRTLFDIMDDRGTGYVRFADIEGRWRDDGAQGLPKGILVSLRKVTPPSGMLSFERFCAGLKICLLQMQTTETEDPKKQQHDDDDDGGGGGGGDGGGCRPDNNSRPPSAPILIAVADKSQSKAAWTSCNTATIRPNNAISQQRTLSMPQLPANNRKDTTNAQVELTDGRNVIGDQPRINNNKAYGPPKPPRTGAAALEGRTMGGGGGSERNLDKSEIRTALQNWQMGLMMNDEKEKRQLQAVNYRADATRTSLLRPARVLGDGKAIDMLQTNQLGLQLSKKSSGRRREPRRHTLQNGIDYNMMKRMKQIEQEKDVLLQGLTAVDKAREWYLRQISTTQEKIKHLGRMGSHVEQWTEAQQERLELQRARVLEVNRHLAALMSTWERGGLPLHMNLAFLSTPTSAQLQQDMLSRLKQQNHRLTEEVSKKSQRIALLEQEKDSLVRELYNRQSGLIQSRRATMIHEQHDQTFII